MKIRFLRNVLAEVEKVKLQETWDKELKRWEELNVEKMDVQGKFAMLISTDGDVYSVPTNSFEVLA